MTEQSGWLAQVSEPILGDAQSFLVVLHLVLEELLCVFRSLPFAAEGRRLRRDVALLTGGCSPGEFPRVSAITKESLAFAAAEDHDAALTLDAKAIEAARQYRFEPTIVKGKPVALELKIEISFQFT